MTVLHNNYKRIPEKARGCVLAIGNFDGIHMGHRALIEKARTLARQTGAPLGVMTFDPHPRWFFKPEDEPFMLTALPMKHRLLAEIGVDHLFAFEFNQQFSQIAGDEFIEHILVQNLGVSHIVVGEDFAFGRARSGTVEMLKSASSAGKFQLSIMRAVTNANGQIYSSTAIRRLLRHGQLEEAARELNWPWQIEAPVIHGDKRGRTLNFPTANQDMGGYVRVPYGVYAVKVLIEGDASWREGVANFGIRPMFAVPQPIFETFIFDFSADIYGKKMRVQPVKHLRPEMSFPGIEALVAQMKEDCITARAVLKSLPVR